MSGWSAPVRKAAGLAAHGLFGAVAVLRGHQRALHPEGCSFLARLEVADADPLGEGLIPPGSHQAVVRFSRGAGLPPPLPDVLGLAIKVVDIKDGPLDLLLVSSGRGAAGKYVFLPAQRFFDRQYSSLLRFQNGPHQILFGALPPPGPGPTLDELQRSGSLGGATFRLVVAPLTGGWRHLGTLAVDERYLLGDELTFDPANLAGRARPRGLVHWLRTGAYAGSRHIRGRAQG